MAADADADGEPGVLARAYDTVTPGYVPRPNAEMNAVGWTLFAGVVLLLVPFLPLLLLIWAISKLIGSAAGE